MNSTLPKNFSNQPATLESLQALIRDDLKQVDRVIFEHIDNSNVPLIPQLARHIVAAGGKRLRPALTLACAKLCGYSGDRHIKLAAAVEFIHTATLLHDDVVDDSHLRRGSATANDVWGNKASVLVGDFLLSRAFQLMVADGSLRVLEILSDASAIISQGEVLQLSIANDIEVDESQYFQVITSKTATLFAAACEIGPTIMKNAEQATKLSQFGLALGIAFQLVDDALDYSSTQATLGKTIGDDFREGKITLPVLIAYREGTSEEKNFWKRTMADVEQTSDDLDIAISLINKYNGVKKAIGVAQAYCNQAKESLAIFPDSGVKNALIETLDFCIARAY
jgi:octaprenyl-diphosphate synthase